METAYFGAGCFWHVEDEFAKLDGVRATAAGYMGGKTRNPTYKQICTDMTGHAEVVKVEYDQKKTKYEKLLELFWSIHDPTTPNRQGPDVGSQYRSVIFYTMDIQKKAALKSLQEQQKRVRQKIVTEILRAPEFWKAEEYHQKYFQKHKITACAVNVISRLTGRK